MNTNTANKLTAIAQNQQKVYDAGQSAGYSQAESDFWDAFQDYGNREFYEYGFSRSGFEYVRPKHKIVPTSRVINMFSDMPNLKRIEKAYIDLSKSSVTSQESIATSGNYAVWRNCANLEIVEDIGMKAGGYYQTFVGCEKLHTIEVVRVIDETGYSSTFNRCYELENLTIEGTIGQNNFNVSYSTKLTHKSLMSIINALADYHGDGLIHTVTLGEANLAKLTDAEKAIATERGWTLA